MNEKRKTIAILLIASLGTTLFFSGYVYYLHLENEKVSDFALFPTSPLMIPCSCSEILYELHETLPPDNNITLEVVMDQKPVVKSVLHVGFYCVGGELDFQIWNEYNQSIYQSKSNYNYTNIYNETVYGYHYEHRLRDGKYYLVLLNNSSVSISLDLGVTRIYYLVNPLWVTYILNEVWD